eukprot:CAMPEP_0203807438 /NCGR_PEP_ID=MMETSP0115-20131106/1069_1 /ASSEMBLY_ACC=CAM_ASM_000227 /TAXON_ID=33651 /ORGANISM="Bicosoecid sp, Strain ms1" /LENGTH=384 /DNA_ID=CAMNT_0050716117 /DNA_START=19 /DNA_END=1170 /DNA_ORIENTATION=+
MSDGVDVEAAMKHKFAEDVFTYTTRDACLYALSVGASEHAPDEKDLPLVYEGAGDGFRVLPTMAVLFPTMGMSQIFNIPSLRFNPMMLLHGEQELRLTKPLPTSGAITCRPSLGGIYDKGKGALVLLDSDCFDESGEKVAFCRASLFIRGIGGFGGDRGPKPAAWAVPSRAPDKSDEYKTTENLALYYRLNGDTNPLHADPSMAAMGGFEKPILHGLCFFGIAGRVILRDFCDNDTTKFKAIKARFAKSVYPGETVITDMWAEEGGRVLFQCRVKERDVVVLTNGVAEVEGAAAALAARACERVAGERRGWARARDCACAAAGMRRVGAGGCSMTLRSGRSPLPRRCCDVRRRQRRPRACGGAGCPRTHRNADTYMEAAAPQSG